jgi:hypothetical protein
MNMIHGRQTDERSFGDGLSYDVTVAIDCGLLFALVYSKNSGTDTDTDTGNVQSRTYAMGEAAIRDRARTTPDH